MPLQAVYVSIVGCQSCSKYPSRLSHGRSTWSALFRMINLGLPVKNVDIRLHSTRRISRRPLTTHRQGGRLTIIRVFAYDRDHHPEYSRLIQTLKTDIRRLPLGTLRSSIWLWWTRGCPLSYIISRKRSLPSSTVIGKVVTSSCSRLVDVSKRRCRRDRAV